MYRQVYYEALNLFVTSTTDRFDQPGFVQCRAASFRDLHYDYQNELDAVCPFYKGDVEQHELSAQHLWNSYEEMLLYKYVLGSVSDQ